MDASVFDLSALGLARLLDPQAIAALAPDYVWSAAAAALVTLGLALRFGPRRPGAAAEAAPAGACDFLIQGAAVQPLTAAARALAADLDPGAARLAALGARLSAECPGLVEDIEALVLYGIGFSRHVERPDGAVEIAGAPRGGAALLTIRPASAEATARRDAEAALARARGEAAFLAAVIDRAPALAWTFGPDGQVTWANAPFRDRFAAPGELPDHRIPDGFAHVIEEVPLTARDGETRRRVAVSGGRDGGRDGERRWYELSQGPGPNGETLGFALEADALVAAEASLRRFIETLTETFAHLPIGLAVFDKNRRLGLFNPALTELVKIDAVWLAGRPSLRDFLERLRETRQMPEQKDFAAWRRKLGEIEEGAREGAYEENWVLPSGKIFRVTGRPHPQGALAFLFEDISTAIQLERKYRSELELSQATLDRMVEAVAVFDASGMLVFVNSAFEALWGLDPMERLEGPGVADLTALWAGRCRPSPAWARLCDFATGGEARASWTDAVETQDGRILQLLVAPLPDASALVVFRNLTEDRAALAGARAASAPAGAAAEALALAALEAPVEEALARIAAALPAAGTPEAFQALGGASRALSDGLAAARGLRGLAPAGGGGAEAILAALAARGHAATLEGGGLAAALPARRALWALALAAAEAAAPGAPLALAVAGAPGGLALSARFAAAPDAAEGPSWSLAARLLAGLGGGIAAEGAPEARVVRVSLPAAGPLARTA